jgi:hypothetical protein
MRKLLAAAGIAVIAITYMADPAAVEAGIGGTINLGMSIVRIGAGGIGGTGGTGTDPGGHVETLPDGTQVWVAGDATVTPANP